MIARILWRTGRLAEHLITGMILAWYATLLGRQQVVWLPRVVCWWHARLLRALGVQVQVEGILQPQCLLVGNHISWLDIPVLGSQGKLYFLSKSEVRHWPLIGWLAEVAGTRFIERGAHQSQAVIHQLGSDLEHGRTVVIFPEGTTTDGREVAPFHPRLFALAQATMVCIQPVALRYRRRDDPAPDLEIPYIGNDSLVANLWRVIRHPGLLVQVYFLDPIKPQLGESRRALAQRARNAIADVLAALDQADSTTLGSVHAHDPLSFQIETRAA